MSAAAVGVALIILAAGVIWGCVVDWLQHSDERAGRDADHDDHQRALMKELRRHSSDEPRWRQ